MNSMNELLSQRTKKNAHPSKMAEMAKQSSSGHLTSFSGVFSVAELSKKERLTLEELLQNYSKGEEDFSDDLQTLISLTSEVKAINNQAALLHGERIKKAHQILTRYRDGAFTSWLIATYGNRQTPYNFLQYYEFYQALPKLLRPRLEEMPRQAVYTLASRDIPFDEKKQIVETYNGETKTQLLATIRLSFPLDKHDLRRENIGEKVLQSLQRTKELLRTHPKSLSRGQKAAANTLLKELHSLL